MIFDRIENLPLYSFPNEFLNEAINHILTRPLEEPWSNENIRKNFIQFTTSDVKEKRFEAHKKFIDIHIVLEGKEYIECAHIDLLTNKIEYDEANDVLFGDVMATSKLSGYLEKGSVLITFPEDTHLVGAHIDLKQDVKKIILKVPV